MISCKSAHQGPDGKWTVEGIGIDGGRAKSLPALFRTGLFIAVGIGPYDAEPGALVLRILSPDMEVRGSWTHTFHAPKRGPLHREGDEGRAFSGYSLVFEADSAGTYTVEARIDDQPPVTYPLTVLLSD